MPDTTPLTANQPSPLIESLLAVLATTPNAGQAMAAMMQRQSELGSPLAAQLTGIALDPDARHAADQFLDTCWAEPSRRRAALETTDIGSEVIIGSGFHAAVYAATRVRSGYPKPVVLERSDRVGGTFAMTARPTFYLNSRNRPGSPGLAGDQAASLNYLPGAPIQAANVSMAAYQTNTDMALVIRLALAQFAEVVTGATVLSVARDGTGAEIELADGGLLRAGRVIDARGLGDPVEADTANATTILTFPQLMHRMAGTWPLRGLRRVAVIGGGDSATCAVESLLGLAPPPPMAAAALDAVERIDWYSDDLPDTCEGWQQQIRGRYQAIGRWLRPDRAGVRCLRVVSRRARPVALPDMALVEGRTYDLVILATGNQETAIDGLDLGDFDEYATNDATMVARRHYSLPAFRIGPHARLPFTRQERAEGIADIPANAASMFRTATKTAALAATLPSATQA